jgi:hypothetical protein
MVITDVSLKVQWFIELILDFLSLTVTPEREFSFKENPIPLFDVVVVLKP